MMLYHTPRSASVLFALLARFGLANKEVISNCWRVKFLNQEEYDELLRFVLHMRQANTLSLSAVTTWINERTKGRIACDMCHTVFPTDQVEINDMGEVRCHGCLNGTRVME